jgi:2-hydroxycyclohexanecarboxyl-CoA dehydrogenase
MAADGIERDGIKPGDVVVVTGGGGGFGQAFCRRFARGGAKVAVWDIATKAGEEVVREIAAAGGQACFINVDLARAEEIDGAVAQTLNLCGVPYCIINNASIYPRASVIDMAPQDWEHALRVNITAP